MFESLIFIVVGLVGLWVGADLLIRGTKNIATYYGLPYLFIGLAFVSIGTSIPEIAVSIAGALQQVAGIESSGIVVGNKVGSALSQLSLIIGILAFFLPLKMFKRETIQQGSFLIVSTLLVFGLAADGVISRLDAIIAFAAYMTYYLFLWLGRERGERKPAEDNMFQSVVYAVFGLAVVLLTSRIVVFHGVVLAESLGVAQSLIGSLLIGLGTGLPELSVAVASFRHKAMQISMGDLIGSNICDLLLALGAGAVITNFSVDPILLLFDIPVLVLLSFGVVFFLYTKRELDKWEGCVLISFYLIYAAVRLFVLG